MWPDARLRFPAFLIGIVAAVLAMTVTMTTALPGATVPARAATSPVVFGLNDHWYSDLTADDAQIGHGYRSGVVGTFLPWTTKPSSVLNYATWARSRGAVPMLDLYPPTTVTLAQIASGSQDAYLRPLAASLKSWGHPFLFRLFPEMNGLWESYSPGVNGQTSAQFVAAWRHVVGVFHAAGATQVKFVWNPDRLQTKQRYTFAQLWPGASYVDWVGLDLYAWQDATHGTVGPYSVAKASVDAVRAVAPTKPLMVPEVGVAPYWNKPSWLADHVSLLRSLGVKIVVYFNETKERNWRVDSGPSSSANLTGLRKALAPTSVLYAGRTWPGYSSSMAALDHLVAHGWL
ncbi:MAG: glycoside hydrolase family 26 protein [Actinomycetales bacterium]